MKLSKRLNRLRRERKEFFARYEWVPPPPGLDPGMRIMTILRNRVTFEVVIVNACRQLNEAELMQVVAVATRYWQETEILAPEADDSSECSEQGLH